MFSVDDLGGKKKSVSLIPYDFVLIISTRLATTKKTEHSCSRFIIHKWNWNIIRVQFWLIFLGVPLPSPSWKLTTIRYLALRNIRQREFEVNWWTWFKKHCFFLFFCMSLYVDFFMTLVCNTRLLRSGEPKLAVERYTVQNLFQNLFFQESKRQT